MFFSPVRLSFARLWPGLIPVLVFLAASCEKPAGPGGKASIKGQVIEKTYDRGFRVLQSELPAADEDVYIKYGNDQTPSDDRKTSPEGYFEFKYLSKGDYTVYVYSEDTSGNSESGTTAVENAVNLSSDSHLADIGQLTIHRTIEIDEGNASITGTVLRVNYAKDFAYIKDTVVSEDLDVFLVYEDDTQYFDRIRTMFDGTFTFTNLIKGTYRVFVYADDILGGSVNVPVEKTIEVNTPAGAFNAGILYRPVED